jgi:hypothetical protein
VLFGLGTVIVYNATPLGKALTSPRLPIVLFRLAILPAVLLSMWMWLPFIAGYGLRALRHFDKGFKWFIGHFDVEHKPLQAIGLVAAVFMVVAYWSAMAASRFF